MKSPIVSPTISFLEKKYLETNNGETLEIWLLDLAIKTFFCSPVGVAQLVELCPMDQEVTISFPVRAHVQ